MIKRSWPILLSIGFVLINLMILAAYGTAWSDIFLFIAAVLAATLVPGLLALNILGLYRGEFYRFPLAMALGICLDIIIYSAVAALDIKPMLYLLFGVITLLYIWKGYWRDDIKAFTARCRDCPLRFFLPAAAIAGAGLLLVIIIYFIPNQLPGIEAVIYSVDYPWHIGNIVEITNHWYPQDPRLAGSEFHYHIFFYIYIAMLAFLTKIPVTVIFFRLYVLLFLYLLVLAAYFTGSRWYNSRRAGIINLGISLLAGTALLSYPYNLFLKDLFFSPTFFLAVILTLFILTEIKAYLQGKSHLLILLLLLVGVSGAKGSFFPVLWSGMLAAFLVSLLMKKIDHRLGILIITSLAAFAAVYAVIFKAPGGEGINIVPLEIMYLTGLYKAYSSLCAGKLWTIAFFIPLYITAFLSFRLLALMDFVPCSRQEIKEMPLENLILGGIILTSLIPSYLLSYRGSSQYFFLFTGYIGLNLLASGYLYQIFSGCKNKAIQAVALILIMLSLADTLLMINNTNGINQRLAALTSKPLTPELYAGLLYLRDNSPPDAVIGSYRAMLLTEDNPRFYYYSAFSERRFVVEGWMYMSAERQDKAVQRYEDMKTLYFTRSETEAGKIIKQYEIDYLLVDLKSRQWLRFKPESILEKCFQNRAVIIYKVRNKKTCNITSFRPSLRCEDAAT